MPWSLIGYNSETIKPCMLLGVLTPNCSSWQWKCKVNIFGYRSDCGMTLIRANPHSGAILQHFIMLHNL